MKKRILFVDDDPNVLDGFRRVLIDHAEIWDMSFATSAEQALALLAQDEYDAAILDVRMPGKSGIELLAEIKANDETRATEAIVITGAEERSLKLRALDLGAADLLSKPVEKEDLVARLNNVLRAKSFHDELKSKNAALERELLQSQRMQLIGMMAAGIAHDLGNILTAIVCYSDLTARSLGEDSNAAQHLKQIKKGGERATKITRQIVRLTKQPDSPRKRCDLASVIDECLDLLRPSIAKNIAVEWKRPPIPRQIEADDTQIYQVIMNLCINACHAMKQGGVLKIALTEAGPPSGSVAPQIGSADRQYFKLEVSDTGTGMDETTVARIFEPLFTTRVAEGGTGLGLAVVQRIVKDHGGVIHVNSAPGKGASFEVYLPCANEVRT